jgi:replication initiation and membrane attachment protein DnaB
MNIPGKKKKEDSKKKEDFPEKEKDWENPKNPEGTQDSRDAEQLKRQLEEAERRKENLTEDDK